MQTYLFFVIFLISFINNNVLSQNEEEINFVQITDTHLGIKKHNKRTEQIINSINQLPFKIDFVVHTGDIFQNNIADKTVVDKAIDIFKKLPVPLFYVPGNHDILDKDYKNTLKIYKQTFGYTDTVVIFGNTQFIFIDTEPLCNDAITDTANKINWLENQLQNNMASVIFHHNPSVPDFYNNKMHDGWPDTIAGQWSDIINKYNVKAVIAGHFHRNEIHWLNKIPLYVAPPVARFWKRQATYRIFTLKNGLLSYRTVYLN